MLDYILSQGDIFQISWGFRSICAKNEQ